MIDRAEEPGLKKKLDGRRTMSQFQQLSHHMLDGIEPSSVTKAELIDSATNSKPIKVPLMEFNSVHLCVYTNDVQTEPLREFWLFLREPSHTQSVM